MDSQYNSELEKARTRLIKALDQGEKINNLTAAPEWEFYEGWIRSLIEAVVKSMKSDNYLNDHNGYIKAVAQVQAYESVLNGIDKFKSAHIAAANRLNQMENATNE